MKHRVAALSLVAACAAVSLAWTGRSAGVVSVEAFHAEMNGASQRPAVNTHAAGTAAFSFNEMSIGYTINVARLTGGATAVHIHGPAGPEENAPPVATLGPLTVDTTGVIASGVITAPSSTGVTLDSLKAMIRNGKAYVNVHTAMNARGEIRGQIVSRQ